MEACFSLDEGDVRCTDVKNLVVSSKRIRVINKIKHYPRKPVLDNLKIHLAYNPEDSNYFVQLNFLDCNANKCLYQFEISDHVYPELLNIFQVRGLTLDKIIKTHRISLQAVQEKKRFRVYLIHNYQCSLIVHGDYLLRILFERILSQEELLSFYNELDPWKNDMHTCKVVGNIQLHGVASTRKLLKDDPYILMNMPQKAKRITKKRLFSGCNLKNPIG